MSSSAITHVVAFLTRPLIPSFTPAAVSSAQVILAASLATTQSATFTLNAASMPPAPLFAASIGAGIPWAAWLAALGSDDILLFYGPGYVKVRLGGAAVTDIWSEESQGSIVPISRVQAQAQMKTVSNPLFQQNTGARLRATLLSARVRSMRREQAAEPIRIPTLLSPTSDCGSSDSDSDSDYVSDSDSASTTSSDFTSYSNDSVTFAGSPPTTPAKAALVALPAVKAPVAAYRPPFRRAKTATTPVTKPAPVRSAAPVPVNRSKKDTTAYLYQGGVTRVMTGGVMLGPRHVVRATRS
ncbi:hypothetical protein DFH06DRAFT_557208 [Mycena polygramma]|nr:hypothetical protein DFH06DRAFT_557208 [Mycena polygramma]